MGGTLLEEVKQIHSNDDIGDMESFSSTLGTQWDNPLLINFVGKVWVGVAGYDNDFDDMSIIIWKFLHVCLSACKFDE